MMTLDELCGHSLLLDLETRPDGKIFKIGAVFQDQVFEKKGNFNLKDAIDALDRFSVGADYVLGHNLISHDLPLLAKQFPQLDLLTKPVIDTLYLSPLAFPENPYHRLVKNYKLVRQSINNPVADARLSSEIFRDQWSAFEQLKQSSQQTLDFFRFCFDNDDGQKGSWTGLRDVFSGLGANHMELEDSAEVMGHITDGKVCRAALRSVFTQYAWDPAECATLAYCVAWLRVAGHNSVLPPWVRHQFPGTVPILRQLRDTDCGDSTCDYCRVTHNSRTQLQQYYGFDSFRTTPSTAEGKSLQEAIVRHGMNDQPHLAILPTGGGKSLCFQLPALVRHARRGCLTIVISPLQALMKDQVDNLVAKTGTPFAAALYGMLTPPERGQVLESVRLGDVAILYVSPEQLRNRSFREVIAQREIGCWVFDEAHCLSKWGHDFRTDYLYAGRFIREFSTEQKIPLAPICCFTATAQKAVIDEIVDYFRRELGQELHLFAGGVERSNLTFEVQTVSRAEKKELLFQLLQERLPADGAAVVYAATRRHTEEFDQYLRLKGCSSAAFHAGLKAPEKKRIQEDFIGGNIQIICATNAFGMGIDKDNVRLVVHVEIPGSLENYLQEAGRAGRDQQDAECILLYDEQDIETQFQMGAFSELRLRDIAQILRGLRRAKRNREGEIVITAGELLRSEDVDTSFDLDDRQAETKVKTAVSWLERNGFVERNHNQSRIFQGRPVVGSMDEAIEKIDRLNLPALTRRRWLAVLAALMNANPDEGLSADELGDLSEMADPPPPEGSTKAPGEDSGSQRVLIVLNQMAEAGLIRRDLLLTAFVRYKVGGHSQRRLEEVVILETALLKLLQQEEPDPEGWLHLSPRRINQRLLDEGIPSIPEFIVSILGSLSKDGQGLAGQRGSIDLIYQGSEHLLIKIQRDWDALIKTAQLRTSVAGTLLQALLATIPEKTPASAEVLVSFSLDDLFAAIRGDLILSSQVKNELAAIERALMFLHEHKIIILQQGLAVFRQAMTIRVIEPKRRYTLGDYAPLAVHYKERVFQVHVMNEYARLGMEKIQRALGLVAAYFSMDKKDFVRRFFAGRKEILDRATSQESYQRVVEQLVNPVQIAIVGASLTENMLILAGPGSGKTRVVVHRCAFLLRVARISPRSILILCFNRQAAGTLRRRLWDLVGPDASGVTILTYHGLAMRLTGTSLAEKMSSVGEEGIDFDALIDRAIKLLKGEDDLIGSVQDDLRDRLLAGYQHILVDEYQDIDQRQYDLVSAIAGRTLEDEDAKLTIMAVGDDDQNIYSFRGANVEFIRRFEADYKAKYHHLVENFRSTAHIIAAANVLIAANKDRMKTDQAIRINKERRSLDPGGKWTYLDHYGKGRVQIVRIKNRKKQIHGVVEHLKTLKKLEPGLDWSECAVLARTHEELIGIRAALDHLSIPYAYVGRDVRLPVGRIREIRTFFAALEPYSHELKRAGELQSFLDELAGTNSNSDSPWWQLLRDALSQWRAETADAELSVKQATEFLWETLAEIKRERSATNGVFLSTVHYAKGTEFDHVLVADGGWKPKAGEEEEARRVYYVAMTRARQTLTLLERADDDNPYCRELECHLSADQLLVVSPTFKDFLPDRVLRRRYEMIGLKDLYLDYAGRLSANQPVHRHLTKISTGDNVALELKGDRIQVLDSAGNVIARLASDTSNRLRGFLDKIEEARVLAMVERKQDDSTDPDYRQLLKADAWEVPVLEVVWVE